MSSHEVIKLFNSYLKAEFDTGTGMPLRYVLPGLDSAFDGAHAHELPIVRICRLSPRDYKDLLLKPVSFKKAYSVLSSMYEAYFDKELAVRFNMRYELDRASIRITLDAVEEMEGFQLIQVSIPSIVSLRAESDNWLAHCKNGGSVVSIAEAKVGDLPDHPYFGQILHILPVVMLGASDAVCTMEVTAFNDGTLMHVEEGPDGKRAAFGTIKTYRVDGSSWCNSNDADLTRIYGNENTPNLLVEQKSACRIDFTGDYDKDGKVDWLDGAKLIKDRMPKMHSDYYDDKFMYIINLDHPTLPKPLYTLDAAAALVKDVAAVTDYNPQVVYITGWQIEGMDTGYPAADTIGERIGGYEKYLMLHEEAEKVNCNIALHDNYDDTYPHSSAWDPDMVARLPDGSLWKSRLWTRDVSYVLGMAKYMTKGGGLKRIEETCKKYRLQNTTHVDVISWFAIRNDWDPENPASAIKNLYEGRYRIFDEFAKRGLDVTSESLRYPWLGKIIVSNNEMDMWGECPFGGHRIPIVPMIYKNSAIHGGANTQELDKRALNILYNVHTFMWNPWIYEHDEELSRLTETYYLHYVPWFLTHNLGVSDYRQDGDDEALILENNSAIYINEMQDTYSIIYEGMEISRTGCVFSPVGPDKLAFYSISDEELSCPVPKQWSSPYITAHALYPDRKEEKPFIIQDGRICIKVTARVPVIVTGRKAASE